MEHRRLWCCLAMGLLAAVLLGQNAWGGEAMPSMVVSLDGGAWVIAADPGNVGRDQAWWKQPAADAKPARVPGIIQEVLPGCHGVVWYWRMFDAPVNPHAGGRYLVRFGAVDYFAEVWVNDTRVGEHEGGETPFTLDVTGAVRPGEANRLAVRVVNPTDKPIDGMALAEIPHRNKGVALTVGGSYNYGGITEPVDLLMAPAVRIADVFVRPDWKTGMCRIQATVRNVGAAEAQGVLRFLAGPAGQGGEVAAVTEATRALPVGDTVVEAELQIPKHRLWDLDNPFLYGLRTELTTPSGTDEHAVRFGFRDFRVERGYFRLNGKRVFLRSSHTGNHCPVAQILSPKEAPDLLRKDLLYMKSSGFNTIRFIAGIPHPYQLDLCDEIGLMVYTETLAGWCLADSPKMADRFDLSIRETLLRDRNHPSFTLFGLLNETGDGPVFRHAVDSLKLARSLDDTRLILLGSGRWDGQNNIGSVSNPGSTQWECVWGVESPDWPAGPAKGSSIGGYFTDAGDAHVYPGTPHTPEIENTIRTLGQNSKPVFLSEYGIGSLMNAIRELRTYELNRVNPELDDMKFFEKTVSLFTADWKRFGMDGVYAFPEDMLHDSQRLHARQRLLGFDLIRSNPKICGFNLTGLLDHGFTGEGLWTFWREWKPGIVDALKDGWAPLRWCAFVSPMHAYLGHPLKVEVVLANEDVLAPGDYPVALRIVGANGIGWEHKTTLTIPQSPEGGDGPLAVPAFSGEVAMDGPPGEYTLAASMERGGYPAGGRLKFYVSDSASASATISGGPGVLAWGLEDKAQTWLRDHGVRCEAFEGSSDATRSVILAGDVSSMMADPEKRLNLLRRIARGSAAVFLMPQAFRQGDNPVAWLPLKNKGRGVEFPDWLYHKECVAKAHPIFEGLQAKGIMDWDYYGPVISHFFFQGQDTPDDVAATAFALCHSSQPNGYAAGVMAGAYRVGEGRVVLNTFRVLENLGAHPAADRLLINLIGYAARTAQGAAAPLPADFDAMAKEMGY